MSRLKLRKITMMTDLTHFEYIAPGLMFKYLYVKTNRVVYLWQSPPREDGQGGEMSLAPGNGGARN